MSRDVKEMLNQFDVGTWERQNPSAGILKKFYVKTSTPMPEDAKEMSNKFYSSPHKENTRNIRSQEWLGNAVLI